MCFSLTAIALLPTVLCTGRITAVAVTDDGLLLCTAAEDKALKVFDVINFGL